MSIERKKKWRVGFGAAVGVMVAWTTWLAAVPGPGTGHSFTPASLASPFTQDLYATTGNLLPGSVLGGVAFAPDGRVWSAECRFIGTRLHLFKSGTTVVNGSRVHDEESVVDLTANGPLGIAVGGCGLVNHPDGSMYSSSIRGIWKLDATTGQYLAGPFGHGGNALGIAVDPQTLHLVYVGDDCHYQLGTYGPTCTLWDWDPATPAAPAQVFARLSTAIDTSDVLIDGIYFDPTGAFLFAAHREENFVTATLHHGLQIIDRPTALKPATAAVDNSQLVQFVPMVSEPDGVAFHAGDGFVVTLNESADCVDATNHVVASSPTTGACPVDATVIGGTTMTRAIGGTMTRFDFAGANYRQVPTASMFAYGGFRGDLAQVGADGCIYATQAKLFGGTSGTRYDNDVTTSDNSLVQICGGFVAPPGVTTASEALPGDIAGLVFLDANHNGMRDSGEGPLAGVAVTLSTDPTNPQPSAADGTFLFEPLAPGTYTVTTPATAAYLGGSVVLSTAGSSGAITLAADEHKTGLEFGYAPGSIAGTVFEDLNHNTVWDNEAEPPLAGVTVSIAGAALGSAISAADGSYRFNLLASGDYIVTVPTTAGALVLTTVNSRAVTLAPGEDKTEVDFGYAPPLTIACLSPATGQVGVPYSGSAVASGGVTPYTYAIEGMLPAGLTLNAATGEISGTPTATGGTFSVTVTDAVGASASTAASACQTSGGFTIAPAALTIACLAPATGQVGVPYSGSAVASGGVTPYSYAIVGTLPAGLTLDAATGQISGTPTATGSFSVTVTDSNGAGASTATSACSVTIAPAPLTIACVSPATGQVGVAYSGSAVASGGVLPYTYAIVGMLPAGLTLNTATGQISGTPTATGSFSVTVTDANGAGASTATSACSVTIAPAVPTLACVAATMGQVGVAYSSSLVATGGVGPYTYSIFSGSLPAGLTLNASTGAITGTPTTSGPFAFTAQVVDARGTAAGTTTSTSCGITIAPAAPALSCVAATTGQVGVPYSSSLVATGGAGAPYTYSIIAGSLPLGLTLNASTGAITGTPTTAGAPSFTAQVVDARGTDAGTSTSSSCGITIAPAPLTIACVSPATGQVGVAYSGSAVASGGVLPYTYAIVGTLPAGLTLNTATGAITGTPTATGSFSVKVTDSNGAGASTATSACSVTIAPAAPALSCVAATTGQVGVAYNSSLVATGGAGAPYTYSIISGSLPTGLTLNAATGAITGTPTTAGPFSFTARVVDSRNSAAGTTSNSSCGITIGAAAPAGGQCAGAIGDFVWVDLNRNGLQDAGEPGKGSVAVTLKTLSGGVLATTATSSSGLYQFGGLCTGAYVVEMTVPAGFDQTGVGAGSNPALDSNASPATVILATDTSADLTIDFGVVNGFCEKQPVQTELNPTGTHFPGNKGPDAIVRMQHGQRLQEAVDQAADVNGDGYIIVGVVAVDGGLLGGHVSQRVVVNRTYPLPFALIGCSVTLHDPNPGEGQPTGRVLASASAPPDGIGARIFIMDVHAEDSGVAGWLVEGNNRYLRNVYGKRNAVGIRFVGNSNTMHNGSVEENQGHGLVIEGNSNTVTDTNAFSNLGHGVSVSGSGNQILKVDAGDTNKGNGGDGVHAAGAGNLLSEIDAFANGGDGIEIVASAGSPNIVKKARSGEKSGKGNAGNGILVSGPGNGAANPIELEENTVKANGLVGIRVLGSGHQLKKNISGGTASGETNVGCEFLAASGNMNATGNKANGVTVAGADGSVFPTTCVGS